MGAIGDFAGKLFFAWSAHHPYPMALGGKPAREIGVGGGGPALGGSDRTRRERDHGAPIGRKPQPLAPRGAFGGGHLEFRQRPLHRRGLPLGQGPAWRSGRPCAGAGARRSADRLIRPKPALADKTGPAGNSGERGRQRGFPGPRHDQRLAVLFARSRWASARWSPNASACGAGQRRRPCARLACNRAAVRPSRSSRYRSGRLEIVVSTT